jgi:fructose-1,6-bisphosphatase
MNIKPTIIGSLFVSLATISSVTLADGNIESADAFIERTLQGNWKPADTSVSNEKPDVSKSLDLFANSIFGKTPRVTSDVNESVSESAADTFIQKLQNTYRY